MLKVFTTSEQLKSLEKWDILFSECHRRYFHIYTNEIDNKVLSWEIYEKYPEWDKRLFSARIQYYEILQWAYKIPQRLLFFWWN